MLTAAEQEQIIKANNEAFEELALKCRNPQTGEREPDLKVAVRQMVCNYFSVRGWTDPLYSLLSRLQNAALGQDDPLELTEKTISTEPNLKICMPILTQVAGIGTQGSGIGSSRCATRRRMSMPDTLPLFQ